MYESKMDKLGFGGGCHWCTEAVFQSIDGVAKVEQGWIASLPPNDTLSEAVIVHFDTDQVDLHTLIDIHLKTHSCTSAHSMRVKYRSAIYTFNQAQVPLAKTSILQLQSAYDQPILTKVLTFVSFKENKEQYQNYYLKNPEKAFCIRYIKPKLKLLEGIKGLK